ncbi:MAG: hypothetical protein COS99_01710 [Candidatus Omnitrophica bacterium CG07_land_8_20_14_0_80_42_15]|uniref:Prepilin-type N-terminal cleavage/methylation domain-containing protein n=1 Tax=Candidatus Aquitaenariimonas noxiae TaxID=1974741 RepID=A0A2J0L6J8_9BACT|nr:MAG: hypothetical protein COS99_01710 [Candidatus Omnitrophica bacterium CG07_land_8_20_14_0_80_42_15]
MKIFNCFKKDKKGVTFVELMISVLILGVCLGTMLSSFVISKISTAMARHRMEAMNYAQAAMEVLIDDPTAIYTLPAGEMLDLGGTYTGTVANFAAGIDQITVTISWTERTMGGSGVRTEQLVTLVRQ